MEIRTSGIHHLAIRVTDYERAKHFYIDTLGFKKIMEQPGLCLFLAGNTPIGILGSENKTYDYNKTVRRIIIIFGEKRKS